MPHGDITQRIEYSEKYFDETSEYRHVILPRELAKQLPKNRLLTENEWRGIGVQQSRGWEHYAVSTSIYLSSVYLGTHAAQGTLPCGRDFWPQDANSTIIRAIWPCS